LLGCKRPAHYPFKQAEVELALVLGSVLAGWLDRMRLLSDLRDAEEDSLRALAATLASRDRYTGVHVDAVCIYADRLGQRLGLDDAARKALRMGSLLHDIGKIGVSDAILQKAGPLTEVEMMLMRQHTVIGAQIVRNVRRLEPALPVVLYHHERWDGRGYPSGLAGEEIPLGARIVSVVDSFHAMTSMRPYRKAHSEAEGVDELRRGIGAAYEPEIVLGFINLLVEAGGEIHAEAAESK
jgi:putative nucleotidyltransferase with HDIG domain